MSEISDARVGAVARHHFVPASVIGLFSEDNQPRRRKRPIACTRIGAPKAWLDLPENVLWESDLYSAPGLRYWPDGNAPEGEADWVDQAWTGFESLIAPAIELLERREQLDAATWLNALVPWVASIFVRGRDFGPRLLARAPAGLFDQKDSKARINQARLLEMQRILAPVATAQWRVIHASRGAQYINNDLNVAPCIRPELDGIPRAEGWTIPMSRTMVLQIFPAVTREVLRCRADGTWMSMMEHHDAIPRLVDQSNRAIAIGAREMIIGPNKELVERYRDILGAATSAGVHPRGYDVMDGWVQIPAAVRREHEFDWHRLCTVAAQPVGRKTVLMIGPVDWSVLGFNSAVLPINRGLGINGLRFSNVPMSIAVDLKVPGEVLQASGPDLTPTEAKELEAMSHPIMRVIRVERTGPAQWHPLGAYARPSIQLTPPPEVFPDRFQEWRDKGWLATTACESSALTLQIADSINERWRDGHAQVAAPRKQTRPRRRITKR